MVRSLELLTKEKVGMLSMPSSKASIKIMAKNSNQLFVGTSFLSSCGVSQNFVAASLVLTLSARPMRYYRSQKWL